MFLSDEKTKARDKDHASVCPSAQKQCSVREAKPRYYNSCVLTGLQFSHRQLLTREVLLKMFF